MKFIIELSAEECALLIEALENQGESLCAVEGVTEATSSFLVKARLEHLEKCTELIEKLESAQPKD